jgi:hypothetical protein
MPKDHLISPSRFGVRSGGVPGISKSRRFVMPALRGIWSPKMVFRGTGGIGRMGDWAAGESRRVETEVKYSFRSLSRRTSPLLPRRSLATSPSREGTTVA